MGLSFISCNSEIDISTFPVEEKNQLFISESIANSSSIINKYELRVGQTINVFALRKESEEEYKNIPAKWSIVGSVGTLLVVGDGKQAEFKATTQGAGELAVEVDGIETKINLIININNPPTVVNENLDVLANGGAITIDVISNDSDLDGETIEVSSSTMTSNGSLVDNGNGSFDYTPNANYYGADSFTYDISDGVTSVTGSVSISIASPFSWSGRGADNLWSTSANWCGAIISKQCQGGSAPGVSDIAVYSNICTDCDSELVINTSVEGVLIESNYTGTISQGAFDLLIGTSDYIQKAGTFNGGANQITSNGNFLIQGGSFVAPASNLRVNKLGLELEIANSVIFSHNSGHIEINPTDSSNCAGPSSFVALDLGQNITFNDFSVHLRDDSCNDIYEADLQMPGAGDLTVLEDIHIYGGYLANGIIYPQKDVYFHCTSFLSCSRGGLAKLIFNTGNAQQYFSDIGAMSPVLELNSPGGSLAQGAGSNDIVITGLSIIDGDFTGPTGALTMDAYFPRAASLIQTGGSIDLSNSLLTFSSSENTGFNGQCNNVTSSLETISKLTVAGFHINHIDLGCNGYENFKLNIGNSGVLVQGDLVLEAGFLTGGDIEVTGDITTLCNSASDCWRGGNAKVIANGGADQSLTQELRSNFLAGEFEIDKLSGSLILSGDNSVDLLGTDFTFTAGELDFNGLDLIGIDNFSEPAVAPTYTRTTELFKYTTCIDPCSIVSD